jgi:hypothetical protein
MPLFSSLRRQKPARSSSDPAVLSDIPVKNGRLTKPDYGDCAVFVKFILKWRKNMI